MELDACLARASADLSPVSDRPAARVLRAGLVGGTLELDAIVRGRRVEVSYDFERGGRVGVTLPPESVTLRPVERSGDVRVRVRAPFPLHYSHDCWQGGFAIHAVGATERAVDRVEGELGYCE